MRFPVNVSALKGLLPVLLICLLMPAAVVLAQDKPPAPAAAAAAAAPQKDPLSAFNKRAYGQVKDWVLRSAEKVPEESYSYKPTEAVRSFGQIIGHVADAQYLFCSAVSGEKNPALKIEQTRTSKADLIAALKEAYAYCDRSYESMTDTSGTQMVKFFGSEIPKLSALSVNISHTAEHYGNLVTYMRLKNIVPPSSEQAAPPPAPKKP